MEIFEISDFTAVSDFERFQADLEDVLRRLHAKTSDQKPVNREWTERRESLRFGRTSVALNFFEQKPEEPEEQKEPEEDEDEDEFPARCPSVARFFGVRRFLVLHVPREEHVSLDRTQLLLSAAALAQTAARASIPVFVELDPKRRLFAGALQTATARTHFRSSVLFGRRDQLAHLSTCLRLFRLHVPSEAHVQVSARLTYSASLSSDGPLEALQLAAEWRHLSADAITDSPHFSDFQPMRAHVWKTRAVFGSRAPPKPDTSEERAEERIARVFATCLPEAEARASDRKSAPVGSLVWRLAEEVLNCHSEAEVRHLWAAFVRHVRTTWESGGGLPVGGDPDFRFCLVHQKLQLLAKCEQKAEKEEPEEEEGDHVDEEEFFDAEEAEGRARPTDLFVLGTEERIWAPRTQEPAPITEDQLEERARVLQELQAHEADVRARVQSACLVSDMSAFKAANPRADFPDFVRWHSPKDFRPETGLSARFRNEKSAWHVAWRTARPQPVTRQKPLFERAREAHKVLHWLEAQDARALLHHVLEDVRHVLTEKSLTRLQITASRAPQQLDEREALVARANALWRRIERVRDTCDEESARHLLHALLFEPEVQLEVGSAHARLARALLEDARQELRDAQPAGERVPPDPRDTWGPPQAKELVLRARVPRPRVWSRVWPQRMYFCISDAELRVCASDTCDVLYS